MNEYSWPAIRADAVIAFGNELPTDDTETLILEHFKQHPALVVRLIDELGTDYKNGKVRNGWAVLKARLANFRTQAPNVRATNDNERAQAIERAETWIRNAGIHYVDPDEVLDHIFGPGTNGRGQLHPYANDTQLRRRIADLWLELRPIGVQLEAEEHDRAEATKNPPADRRITDADKGRALIHKLVDQHVPMQTIHLVVNRAIIDSTLRTELVDLAADLANDDIAFTTEPPTTIAADDHAQQHPSTA